MENPELGYSQMQEALSFGWNILKNNFWFLIALYAIVGGINFFYSIIYNAVANNAPSLTFFLTILNWILTFVISIEIINISLKFVKGEKVSFDTYRPLFLTDKYIGTFLNFVGASVLQGLIVIGGFILFIIPGIYFALKYQFAPYIVLDLGLSPMDSLKKSSEITSGKKFALLGFGIILAVINIIGVLCLLVGLLVTIPLSTIAYVYIFRYLLHEQTGNNTEVTQVPEREIVSNL